MKANRSNINLIEKAEELKVKIIECEDNLDFVGAAKYNKQFDIVMRALNKRLINPDVYSQFENKIHLK